MLERKRILIVDDEAVIADSLVMVFTAEGYESNAAYSAEEAIKVLSEWTPDLAIVDIRLKKMSGLTFAIQLREQFPGCKVALFTGLTDLTDLLEQARVAGHTFEVIPKPIHPEDLLSIVSRTLSGLGENEFSLA